MKGTVTLSTTDGPDPVSAVLTEHLAIHRTRNYASDWTMTHRPTGLAMGWFDTRREGLEVAAMLERDHADDLRALAKLKFGECASKRGKQGIASKRLRTALQTWRS